MRVLRTLALVLCFVCMTPVIRLTLLGDRLDQHLLERRERLFYRLLLLGSDFAHQHWIGRRLLGAALGLDRHRHGVGPFHGVLDHDRDRVPFGLEEAAWLRSIALYYPDLVGLALRCGGHVLGHQYRPIAPLKGNQLRLYPLLRPRSPERDHLGTLGLVLGLALEALNAALQIAHLSLQEHAPGEQADREYGRGGKG